MPARSEPNEPKPAIVWLYRGENGRFISWVRACHEDAVLLHDRWRLALDSSSTTMNPQATLLSVFTGRIFHLGSGCLSHILPEVYATGVKDISLGLLLRRLPQVHPSQGNSNRNAVLDVFTRFYQQSVGFSYWRGKRDHEVDVIAQVDGRLVPFEVKYREQATGWTELKGMVEFCTERKVSLGYVITKDPADFGLMERNLESGQSLQLLKIPAPPACYWLGKSGIEGQTLD